MPHDPGNPGDVTRAAPPKETRPYAVRNAERSFASLHPALYRVASSARVAPVMTDPGSGGTRQTQRRASRKFRRRPPSPAEQERRQAWGKEWGPKVGAAIRAAIAEGE